MITMGHRPMALEMALFRLEMFLFALTATMLGWDLTCVFVHKTIL